jgi:hypothetical protein
VICNPWEEITDAIFGGKGAAVQLGMTGTLGTVVPPPVLPPHPLFVPAGIGSCDTDIVLDEKSQTNLTSTIVAVAPVREDGNVLLPTLREQVAVPNQPLPICGETDGPLQLLKFKRLSSWVI